jgi:hypothetical protein
MSNLKSLTTVEAIEMLHCRLLTVEAAMCELFTGFRSDLLELFENNLSVEFTTKEKDKVRVEMAKLLTKYNPKGGKK